MNTKYWSQLSFVISLAVRSTLYFYIKNVYKINFKWPNDIFFKNKKISGILIEATNDQKALVVGVGINLISNPDKYDTYWESANLYDLFKIKISPNDMSILLLEEIQKYIKVWYDNGFSYIKQLWIENALFLNDDLYSIDLKKNFKGKFVDIDEFGQIILKDNNGYLIKLSSGTFLPTKLMD